MGRTGRVALLFLVASGPLTPAVVLFLLAVPPLILLSGWPTWLQATVFVVDIVTLVAAAVVLGPPALEEIHAFLDSERDRE